MMQTLADVVQKGVRPFVTVAFTVALIGGFFTDRIDGNAFLPIASLVIGFWFSSRQTHTKE